MPDFHVVLSGSPNLTSVEWVDPASITRPSRITKQNARVYRRINASVGSLLIITAILNASGVEQPDSVVGKFTMWPIETPSDDLLPLHIIPIVGTSSVQFFTLKSVGHYTFAIRHEGTGDAPFAAPGGVIVVHVESVAL